MSQPLQGTTLLYRTDPVSLLQFRLLPLLSVPVLFLRSDQRFRLEDKLPGSEVLDFAGSIFSGNDTDIDNKAEHPVDMAKAIVE